jgi:hypothetical protein
LMTSHSAAAAQLAGSRTTCADRTQPFAHRGRSFPAHD